MPSYCGTYCSLSQSIWIHVRYNLIQEEEAASEHAKVSTLVYSSAPCRHLGGFYKKM